MNQKLKKDTIARITRLFDQAAKKTGMAGQWQFKHVFDDGIDGDMTSGTDMHPTTAITTAQWDYKRAKVRWFLTTAAPQTDAELFTIAVHELGHCLLASLDCWLNDEEDADPLYDQMNEYTTECVTRALLHAMGRPIQ